MRNSTASRFLWLLGSVLSLQLTTNAVLAADPDQEQDDPPDRVARLSYLQGTLSVQSPDSEDWTEAAVNRPLTTGDRLRSESDARAELQTGELDIHMDEHSDASFSELTDDVVQLRLTQGQLHLSVRRLRDNEVVEIDTPQAAVTIAKPGEYTVALVDNGNRTLVKTYAGECEVVDHRETIVIKTGQQSNFFASELTATPARAEPIGPRNAFDAWAYDRSRGFERSASARYVAPDVIGYRDLDDSGEWMDDGDYGHVWYPTQVAVDWSPYRFGHWAWISPWGWTWVDDAAWGFAPFHYGRWAQIRGRWCWVPGPVHVRPVYAPALVAWVGSAPSRGVSVSIGFGGGIGWFPLAPREIFVPGYACSRRHLYNVNYANTVVVNTRIINRVYDDRSTHFNYANRQIHGAVTVMKPEAFAASRPVRDHIVHVEPRDLERWKTHNAMTEVRPSHVNVVNPAVQRSLDRNAIDRNARREVMIHHAPMEQRDANRGVAHERNTPPARWNGGQSDQRARTQNNAPSVERPQNERPQNPGEKTPGENRAVVTQQEVRERERRVGNGSDNRVDGRFNNSERREQLQYQNRPATQAPAQPPAQSKIQVPQQDANRVQNERAREVEQRNQQQQQWQQQRAEMLRTRELEQRNQQLQQQERDASLRAREVEQRSQQQQQQQQRNESMRAREFEHRSQPAQQPTFQQPQRQQMEQRRQAPPPQAAPPPQPAPQAQPQPQPSQRQQQREDRVNDKRQRPEKEK